MNARRKVCKPQLHALARKLSHRGHQSNARIRQNRRSLFSKRMVLAQIERARLVNAFVKRLERFAVRPLERQDGRYTIFFRLFDVGVR